eukprot:TRINITY_DN399_c0_g1_i1.p1 TRINITY_DN399_c0_g1~~TRINITY_DN399_c0_g1_i1.p1  ORF type:complete len:375 (-),score=82.24 TRINITY_DN399_c0_g1_i1:55-1146(-)
MDEITKAKINLLKEMKLPVIHTIEKTQKTFKSWKVDLARANSEQKCDSKFKFLCRSILEIRKLLDPWPSSKSGIFVSRYSKRADHEIDHFTYVIRSLELYIWDCVARLEFLRRWMLQTMEMGYIMEVSSVVRAVYMATGSYLEAKKQRGGEVDTPENQVDISKKRRGRGKKKRSSSRGRNNRVDNRDAGISTQRAQSTRDTRTSARGSRSRSRDRDRNIRRSRSRDRGGRRSRSRDRDRRSRSRDRDRDRRSRSRDRDRDRRSRSRSRDRGSRRSRSRDRRSRSRDDRRDRSRDRDRRSRSRDRDDRRDRSRDRDRNRRSRSRDRGGRSRDRRSRSRDRDERRDRSRSRDRDRRSRSRSRGRR